MDKQPERNQRNPHSTKRGPGRRHKQGDGTHAHLTLKQRRAGMYGKGLRNWINGKQAAAQAERLERRIAREAL